MSVRRSTGEKGSLVSGAFCVLAQIIRHFIRYLLRKFMIASKRSWKRSDSSEKKQKNYEILYIKTNETFKIER